jgi:predicted transcriptional regulator
MKRNPSSRPTDAELAILNTLWEHGPSTVREIHEVLHRPRGVGYTTTLKLMQIMADKGLLLRNETQRAHVYRPAESRCRTLGELAGDLIERAFGGSAEHLVMHLLGSKRISPKEIARIRELLNEHEK